MKKVICSVVIGLAVLGLGLSPARADLFGFTISNPLTAFDGSVFTVNVASNTGGDLYRNIAPAGTAYFSGNWAGAADFAMTMTISNVTANSADGSGTFTYVDKDGDTVAGNVAGMWDRDLHRFDGSLSNVAYTPVVNNTFDGTTSGSVSMIFDAATPWYGALIELTSNVWFDQSFRTQGGSIDATVTPVPAALLIGLLGLGTAGLKLRKFA